MSDVPGAGDAGSRDWPILVQTLVLGVVAGASWWGAARTAGVLHVVLAVLLVAAGGFFLYLVGMVLTFHLVAHWIDRLGHDRPEGWRDRVPVGVRLVVVVLTSSWALTGWLYGYDAVQWWLTGASTVLVDVIVLLAFLRRSRMAVPDGPDGPRHRRSPN